MVEGLGTLSSNGILVHDFLPNFMYDVLPFVILVKKILSPDILTEIRFLFNHLKAPRKVNLKVRLLNQDEQKIILAIVPPPPKLGMTF